MAACLPRRQGRAPRRTPPFKTDHGARSASGEPRGAVRGAWVLGRLGQPGRTPVRGGPAHHAERGQGRVCGGSCRGERRARGGGCEAWGGGAFGRWRPDEPAHPPAAPPPPPSRPARPPGGGGLQGGLPGPRPGHQLLQPGGGGAGRRLQGHGAGPEVAPGAAPHQLPAGPAGRGHLPLLHQPGASAEGGRPGAAGAGCGALPAQQAGPPPPCRR